MALQVIPEPLSDGARHGRDQGILPAEIMGGEAAGIAGPQPDLRQGEAFDPPLRDQLNGGVQQAALRLGPAVYDIEYGFVPLGC